MNTWIVCIHFSSIVPVEKLLQSVDKCLMACNEQLTLITETREKLEKHLFSSQLLSEDKNNAD